jgi:ATP-dependent Lhr-like helicase
VPAPGEVQAKLRAELQQGGALFFADLARRLGGFPRDLLSALWDLVWAGEVTNDAWTPLRAGRRYGVPRPERRPRRFSRRRATGIAATQGRWSLADRLFAGDPDRRALAELLLERQGIVTRDGVRAEGIVGGYSAVYGELKALETLGLARRGYLDYFSHEQCNKESPPPHPQEPP